MSLQGWTFPPDLYGLEGQELNCYFANLASDWQSVRVEIDCAVGRTEDRRWTGIPDRAGDFPFALKLSSPDGQLLAERTSVLHVAAHRAGRDQPLRLLAIGDSITNQGRYTAGLLAASRYDPLPLRLIGTRGEGENRHEGRPGWKAQDYLDVEISPFDMPNAFWGNGFDPAEYVRRTANEPDIVVIKLGINDLFTAYKTADSEGAAIAILDRLQTMVDRFHEWRAPLPVGLVTTIPPSASEDAFGADYGNEYRRWRYLIRYFRFVELMTERFAGRQAEAIHLIPANLAIDPIYGFPGEEQPANARSSELVRRGTDAVHPSMSGALQIADVIFAWLKHLAQEKLV